MRNSQKQDQPTHWLITGGCGFIGASLVKNLAVGNKHFIRVIDNLSIGTRKDLACVCEFAEIDGQELGSLPLPTIRSPIHLVIGSILDPDFTLKAAEGMDIIIHLAANTGVGPSIENPRKDLESNVIGTFNMLEAARKNKIKRFVFASSGAPIGKCEPPIHEELAPHPVSPYGASKLAGEGYCSAYYRTFGLETVMLRFGNVYGPGSGHKNSVVAKFIKNAMEGKALKIYGDGNQTRDFIYINDLIRAIRISAAVPDIGGETFQIATSSEHTVNELINQLKPILSDAGVKNVRVIFGESRLGDVSRTFSDTSKAEKMLNWRSIKDLKTGLKQTTDWFLKADSLPLVKTKKPD